ncbi:MAG: hypothetical protein A2Y25_03030 [Candidatus Melainabacteria bacterium GWF2_37_15]|nr:MAG: hypothetical protein A2Y25_03030 [Candidatus Melainabacteria bacterium GWF2_37_15]
MDSSVCPTKLQMRKIYKRRVYYFFLALILFVCLLQFLCGSLYNFTRYIVLNNQINTLQQLNESAQKKNQQLKTQLKVYSSYKGIEELARNNLKLVGKDEVLVLIKNR